MTFPVGSDLDDINMEENGVDVKVQKEGVKHTEENKVRKWREQIITQVRDTWME